MIIGFSEKTSKILPKIFCRKFRHCVVIFQTNKKIPDFIMVQIGSDGIKFINIKLSGIKKLESFGWVFIKTNIQQSPVKLKTLSFLTCVGFAKRALGIHNPLILTPDQLYKHLKKLL